MRDWLRMTSLDQRPALQQLARNFKLISICLIRAATAWKSQEK
jgi:hypothetical protein